MKPVLRLAPPAAPRAIGLSRTHASAMLSAMEADLALFRRALEAIASIGNREWEEIRPHLSVRRFARGDLLQSAGHAVENVYFLVAGLVREYYTTPDGKERSKSFVRAGGFAAAYTDHILSRRSHMSIQALQDTRALVFPIAIFVALRETNPVWEKNQSAHSRRAVRTQREARVSVSYDERVRALSPVAGRFSRYRRSRLAVSSRVSPRHHADRAEPHSPTDARGRVISDRAERLMSIRPRRESRN